MLLLNAFSLNMVHSIGTMEWEEVTTNDAKLFLSNGIESAVGHADTAAVFSSALGMDVPCQRTTLSLRSGSEAIVGQYVGPRLPEGATTLPDGASIKWLHISIL